MRLSLRTPTTATRRLARSAVVRAGREEQARQLLGRVREARAAFDPPSRRELRDEHAMHVALAAILRRDSHAIDVGANEGATLATIVRVAPDGRHIAYEPLPRLNDRLVGRFPDVDVRRAALSDEAGTVEFTHVVDAPAYSGLRRRRDLPAGAAVEQIAVRTERLDDAVAHDYVPTLIKIDVEGAELHVLRGATATLARAQPYVLFEHGAGGADLYGSSSGELFDLLEQTGLRVFDLDGDGPYTRTRFEGVFEEPIWNFLAVPG